jgi:hypothetical protein
MTAHEQHLLSRARPQLARCCTAVVAIAVETLLRVRPLPQVCHLLGIELGVGEARTCPPPACSRDRIDRVRREVEWVYSRLGLPDTCLRRSLTAGFRLRVCQPRLVIGIRKAASLDAHAWLVASDSVLDWAEKHGQYLPMR